MKINFQDKVVIRKVGISSIIAMLIGAISFVIGSVMVITSIFEMDKTMGNIGIFLYIAGIVLLVIGVSLVIIWLVLKFKK